MKASFIKLHSDYVAETFAYVTNWLFYIYISFKNIKIHHKTIFRQKTYRNYQA